MHRSRLRSVGALPDTRHGPWSGGPRDVVRLSWVHVEPLVPPTRTPSMTPDEQLSPPTMVVRAPAAMLKLAGMPRDPERSTAGWWASLRAVAKGLAASLMPVRRWILGLHRWRVRALVAAALFGLDTASVGLRHRGGLVVQRWAMNG